MADEEDNRLYNVVINHEEQYSIWFADREPPAGWRIVPIPQDWLTRKQRVSEPGGHLKATCLDYIDEVWIDMRPLSLRRAMAESSANPAA